MIRLILWVLLLPLQIIIALTLGLSELLRTFLPRSSRKDSDPEGQPLERPLCSIVILNWNGRPLLEESLPAVARAVAFSQAEHEVILVDNGSSDGSLAWVQTHHPSVRIIPLEKNIGFGEGNNRGIEEARHKIVVLLNNDMIVAEDFLPPLLEPFSDGRVFAVSSQIVFPDGKRRQETGNAQGRLRRGFLHLSHEPLLHCHSTRRFLPVLWPGGGSSAFHRERFLDLGGFSTLFSPCYVEDTDIGYRAWRRGWRVLLAAESTVLHKHRSTSARVYSENQIKQLIEERKLWYLWKNFQWRTLVSHFLLFPIHLRREMSLKGYLRALRKIPRVFYLRMTEARRSMNDSTILEWTTRPLSYLQQGGSSALFLQAQPTRLRILVVSAYLPHLGYHGGAGRVFQLIRQVSRKHDITLLTFVESDKEREQFSQITPYCRRLEHVYRRDYSPISSFPYEPFEEFNCLDLRLKMEEILAEEDFDVVHFEWAQMVQYADLVPAETKRLLTEIEVNYAAHFTQIKVERRAAAKVKKFYDTLQTLYRELELCRRVDHVICVTDLDRDYLRGFLPRAQLEVVNTGVDTRYFAYDDSEIEPNSLVFVGAFRHDPNLDAMAYFCDEILPRVLISQPDAQLYIVGSSPPPSIRDLADHPRITVTGFVPDIRDYYRKAQVVVVPLRTGVGIRGKILEAWSVGKAVVATSLACQGIRAVHGKNVLIADQPADFAAWTTALLRQADFAAELGRAGRKTVEELYDWEAIGEQMSLFYESIARRRSQVAGRRFQRKAPSDDETTQIKYKDSEKFRYSTGSGEE